MTNEDILAAWLVHAHFTSPSESLFPTNAEVEQIIREKPGRWMEAHAVASAFVKQVHASEPEGLVETGSALMRALRGVNKLQQKAGNVLSAPPVGLRK